MTQHRLLQQAAALLFYQETCLVFVIGAVGNGMQILLLSVGAIIYSFTVNEKSEKGLKSVKTESIGMWGGCCFVEVSITSLKSSDCGTFGVDE